MHLFPIDRYIVKFRDQRVLRKHELDAFLCTAVSPLLRDVETMQEMKVGARYMCLYVKRFHIEFEELLKINIESVVSMIFPKQDKT